ncbi:uncharacterized protein PAC_19718 [Phialocephala subalpina]|uniref:Fungal N-terminal domain-containing protein n=1 Tax=Phialocephala subalpina TaxID=576137 RepID=A0A1L7XXS3_9HELO|nr:uncharacterized protein PAC_19718 [Phialocephala subalpina]
MAEAVGLVGSIVGIVGFAGQLAQGSNFLFDFFKDLTDAPNDVRKLLEELKFLESLITSIQSSFSGHDQDLEQALKVCCTCIGELVDLIKANEPADNLRQRQKAWKQFSVALKRTKFSKHLGNLERAKLMLLLSWMKIMRNVYAENSESLQATQLSISDLSLAYQTALAASIKTQTTVEQIQQAVSGLASTSASMAQMTTETYSLVGSLPNDTRQIQNATDKIEGAAQKLVAETLSLRPKLLEEVSREMEQTISKTLQTHLRINPNRNANKIHRKCASKHRSRIIQSSGNHQLDSSQRSPPCLKQLDPPVISRSPSDRWIKETSVETRQELTKGTIFGTLVMATATVAYFRQRSEQSSDSEVDRKHVSHTTVTLLPASWLFSKGAVLKVQTSKLFDRTNKQSCSQFNLSTVNIRPPTAKIFKACRSHDLDAIRRLFDECKASPYDVDDDGRNLLGYVFLGARFTNTKLQRSPILHLARLSRVVDYLLNQGVDTGTLDMHYYTPVMLFISCWFQSGGSISKHEDHFQYLLNKLLRNAKSDPFSRSDARIGVNRKAQYCPLEFPGLDFSDTLPLAGLNSLIRQEEWPLSWDPGNLYEFCDAAHYPWLMRGNEKHGPEREHVSFWVTCTASEIKAYLEAKSDLLSELLKHNRLLDTRCACHLENCVNLAIHKGAEVIALLSEHDYYRGSAPWLRHRTKKLILVQAYMLKVIKLLLILGSTQLANRTVLENFSEHAADHNARTFNVWNKALKEASLELQALNRPYSSIIQTYLYDISQRDENHENCKGKSGVTRSPVMGVGRDYYKEGQQSSSETRIEDPASGPFQAMAMDSTNVVEQHDSGEDDSAGWETDESDLTDSAWETEEEWEEGYKLESAVDRVPLDDHNPDLEDTKRHTCSAAIKDYDEEYWSHVYDRIKGSNMDSTPASDPKGKLERITGIVGTFVSAFV